MRLALCPTVIVSALALGAASAAQAQDMEPRSYSNAPIGLNFLVAGYAYTRGGLAFDGALPITDPHLNMSSAVLAYGRVLEVWGQSAKLNVLVPLSSLTGTVDYAGQSVQRDVTGLADPAVKLSVNLYGAPALSLKEFAAFEQDLIVGASLRVTAPLGNYENTRLVNLGTNRWSFKPEIGVSQSLGQWTVEALAAVMLYTTINGTLNNDLQQNWRLGGTLVFPVDRFNSIKLYASSGVAARTGNDFDLIGLAWQVRWGAGL